MIPLKTIVTKKLLFRYTEIRKSVPLVIKIQCDIHRSLSHKIYSNKLHIVTVNHVAFRFHAPTTSNYILANREYKLLNCGISIINQMGIIVKYL